MATPTASASSSGSSSAAPGSHASAPPTPASPGRARSASGADPDSAEAKAKLSKNKKINRKHPEFELTYDMMLGIRTTVGLVESKALKEKLSDSDMEHKTKWRFPHGGSRTTPPHQMRDFKFKDYAPEVFRAIRARFDINPADYILCVCGNFQYLEFISNSKSGQFFFYSHDRRYMIKTVTGAEAKFLQKILPSYYAHLMKNPNTLVTRFYGLHRVMPHGKKEVHFLIMGSVFYTRRLIHTTFDLKGSKQGRNATAKERANPSCVYKDNDFLDMKSKIFIDPGLGEVLRQQIARDVEFLRQLGIMDYSLLLGINDSSRDGETKTLELKTDGREAKAELTRPMSPLPSPPPPPMSPTSFSLAVAAASGGSAAVAAAPAEHTAAPPATAADAAAASSSASSSASASASSSSSASTSSSTPAVSGSSVSASSSTSSSSASSAASSSSSAPATETKAPPTPGGSAAAATTGGGSSSSEMVVEEGDPLADTAIGERRQTHYGLPKRYNAFSRPTDINFVAPDFADLGLKPAPGQPVKRPVIEPASSLFTRDDGGMRGSRDGRPSSEVYYMGIIDILTEYGAKKKVEHTLKSIKHDKNDISAVSPLVYANRFKEFMNKAIA